ncbi:MAG: hypothetical protein NC420_02085 [Eubacterium sp.]|nr:hypothetical protein [Eubacterium sp.]
MNGKQELTMVKQDENDRQVTVPGKTGSVQAAVRGRINDGETAVQEETGSVQATVQKKIDDEQTDKRSINGSNADKHNIRSEQTAEEQGSSCGAALNGLQDIWETAQELKPDPHKKQISLLEIQNAIESKKICNIPTFGELIQIQLQYISPAFWALQGGLLALMALFLHRLPEQGAELKDYLWWSSIAAAWMGVLSHGALGKPFSSRMAELEQSCYINLSQMWTIKMLLTTGVDIVFLTALSGGVAVRTDTFFGRIAVYLLVPFVLSNICCLSLIGALRGGRGKYTMAVLAVLTALSAMSPMVFPDMYAAAYLWVWFCLLASGAAVFAGQIRSCYGRMMRGELICLN